MSTISLSALSSVAPQAGYPRDKSSLIRRLTIEGATRQQARVKRGKLGFVYEVETLPAPLRQLVAEAAIPSETEQASTDEDTNSPTMATCSKVGFERFLKAPPSQREEADERLKLVWCIKELVAQGVVLTAAYAKAAEAFGVSASTAKNAWRVVRNLHPADWLPALVKDYKGRQPDPVDERVLRYFFSDYGRVEQPQLQAVHERTCAAAATNGWGKVPSAKTLKRRWDALPKGVRVLMREGDQALDKLYPAQPRDRSDMKPLDGINMDSRTWDLWVVWHNGQVIRPTVTLCQDEATNYLLAWEVTETESSTSYRHVLCKAFTDFGIPKRARFDNTMAAANKALTAGAKGRFRFTDREDDVEGLLPRVGCEVRFTKPANGRAKLVERAFAELKERTEKDPRLAGAYTGRSPAEKPANYGDSAVPVELFTAILAQGIEHYNSRVDRRSSVAFKTSHRAVFETGLQSIPVRRLTEEQRRFFFSLAERRKVTPSGCIQLGKRPHVNTYYDPALQDYAGQDVIVWYNPDDLTMPVMVETLGKELIASGAILLDKAGFNSTDDARQYERGKRQYRKAQKQAANALDTMDAAQAGGLLPQPAASQAPDTPIVQPTFGKTPRKPAKAAASEGIDAELLNEGLKTLSLAQPDRYRSVSGW